jgi:aminopeptidase N/puromycin-sensitive aminopeptidase
MGSCFLLDGRLKADAASANVPIFANAGGHGYYRTEYDQQTHDKLTKEIEQGLSPAERIVLLGDDWALMRVGRLPISKYLDTISQLKGERHRQVWGEVLDSLNYIGDKLVTDRERPRFEQFVRDLLNPAYAELSQKAGNDPEAKALRADLFRVLGLLGKDPKILAEARQITEKYLQAPDSVDPQLAREALPIAASQGDEKLFQEISDKLKNTNDQILRGRYMDALAHFEKPELVKRAMELGISGEIRNQDSTGYLSNFLRNPATRDQAWKFIQSNWKEVAATFTTSSGSYLVSSTGQFCDADAATRVKDFFATHTVPASERALRQAVERIKSCADLKSLQQTNLQSWLFDHVNVPPQATGN